MTEPHAEPPKQRIVGYDLARSLAIFGMVAVNFKIVLGASEAGPEMLVRLAALLDGRAAATFVVLAGVGVALRSQRARHSGDRAQLRQCRGLLFKRSLFLVVVGLVYVPVWPADILHFYGLYIAVGALLLTASPRRLGLVAAAFILGFVLLLLFFDYETGWDWSTLTYDGFWTPAGMVRHLLFNGFHPVVPWTAFLLVGMALGQRDLRDRSVRKKVLVTAVACAAIGEGISQLAIRILAPPFGGEPSDLALLFGTDPMPPMPLYFLSAGGVAVTVIVLSTTLTERFPGSRWLEPLVATGQLALTLYVAHVVIGMGLLEALGLLGGRSLAFALTSTAIFCAAAIVCSWLWTRRFRRGPLEWVMRRLTGG
ncbi:MAG: DUF418 domain-containing protein [bacterium]|nr:DUF418 domain-containing protein [bacterium]